MMARGDARIRLDHIIRDIRRKFARKADPETLFEWKTNQIRSKRSAPGAASPAPG
jgi:hypothetical protein